MDLSTEKLKQKQWFILNSDREQSIISFIVTHVYSLISRFILSAYINTKSLETIFESPIDKKTYHGCKYYLLISISLEMNN